MYKLDGKIEKPTIFIVGIEASGSQKNGNT